MCGVGFVSGIRAELSMYQNCVVNAEQCGQENAVSLTDGDTLFAIKSSVAKVNGKHTSHYQNIAALCDRKPIVSTINNRASHSLEFFGEIPLALPAARITIPTVNKGESID